MTMQIPKETQLLLETARAASTVLDRERIRTLAGDAVDWGCLVAGAERHQITPLVHRALHLHAAEFVPAETLRLLRIRSLATASRNLRFAEELVRINALLLAKGLRVISYKGPSAAVALYGDLRLRTFGDMDFLVRRNDLDAVCDLLRDIGYENRWIGTAKQKEVMEREQKEYCFVAGPVTLEPHWSITARRFPFDIDYDALWTRAQSLAFHGSHLLTFSPEDMLLVLCVCGGKGRYKRIQMISDVAEAIWKSPGLDWDICFERATASRSARMLRLGLHLAHSLLGAPLPETALIRIAADRNLPGISAKIRRSLWIPHRENSWTRQGPSTFSPLLFSLRDGPFDKLQYLLRTMTTPQNVHMNRYPLINSLSWAYYLIVPLHDYMFKPLWDLLRQAVRKLSGGGDRPG